MARRSTRSGNGLLAEQFPVHRRGFAISTHIAGGNVGTVAVPLVGAWLIAGVGWGWTVVLFGIPPIVIGVVMLLVLREHGTDRPPRSPMAACATRSGPLATTATWCWCSCPRCSAAGRAVWAC